MTIFKKYATKAEEVANASNYMWISSGPGYESESGKLWLAMDDEEEDMVILNATVDGTILVKVNADAYAIKTAAQIIDHAAELFYTK